MSFPCLPRCHALALSPLVSRYIVLRTINSDRVRERVHLFNTFLYKQYGNGRDFSKVESWTRGTDVLLKDFWFIPIHDR